LTLSFFIFSRRRMKRASLLRFYANFWDLLRTIPVALSALWRSKMSGL